MPDLRLSLTISPRWGARCGVLVRTFAATVGGYGIAALWGALLSAGLSRFEGVATSGAVLTGMLSSFAICVCVVMWVFAARDLKRMALGLLIPAVLLGVALWLLRATA
ncbi:hypothetical protein [Asticcacaulis benevestitus]|uniref:hypothetical protein n=1 Tax=Asticcacaulis benevestitus TaxID=347481 RepID=UPI00191C6E3A|nr:hypothetical protein [Asticcacaulis benevestitus]